MASPNPSTFTYSPESKEAILTLVLAWARYDALVSQWLIVAFDLPLDVGAILLGNMDTRGKIDKLKALYAHHGLTEAVENIGTLYIGHMAIVGIRNTLMHSGCGGLSADDPDALVFAPVKNAKGALGSMVVEIIKIEHIKLAAQFAQEMGDTLYDFVNPLLVTRLQEPPPLPPEFLPGLRQDRKAGKRKARQRQPRSSREK